jgi:hypothetical protein
MSDDEQWLNALAGRSTMGASPGTELEARLLRAAVRQSPHANVPAPTRDDEQRLLKALRASQPIQTAHPAALGKSDEWANWRCGGCARRWQQMRQWFLSSTNSAWGAAGMALVAGLAVFAVVESWQSPQLVFDKLPPAMRNGNEAEVRVIAVADPQAIRNQLANEMSAQGAEVRRYERLGRFGIDARLPDPVPEAMRRSLLRLGLPATISVAVRLEFEVKTP